MSYGLMKIKDSDGNERLINLDLVWFTTPSSELRTSGLKNLVYELRYSDNTTIKIDKNTYTDIKKFISC